MELLTKDTARDVMVFMADSSDHVTGKTGLTLTITASKNAAAFASISPTVTERSDGWYKVALTSSHTDTLGDFVLHVTATGADPSDVKCLVLAVNLYDAVRGGMTALPNAAADAAGGLVISDAGGLNIDSTANRVDILFNSRVGNVATVTDVTPAANSFDTGLTEPDGHWDDALLVFTGGTLAGQSRPVGTFVAGTFSFDEPFTAAPANGDPFLVVIDHTHPVSQIQSGLATAAALAAVDTVVDAIKAKTDALPADPADASDVAARFDAVDAALVALDDYVDTEVAAIKAKTDTIPSWPTNFSSLAITAGGAVTAGTVGDKTGYALTAAYDPAKTAAQAGDQMALTAGTVTAIGTEVNTVLSDDFTAVQAALTVIDDYLDTEVAAIKAKTDLIPASPAAVGSAMTLEAGERTSVADAVLTRSFESVQATAGPYTLAALIPASFLFTFSSTQLSTYRIDGTTPFQTYDLTSTAALGANVATSMGV